VGKGSSFPLFALSGTIASHLFYNYVLCPGAMMFLPPLVEPQHNIVSSAP
jgi:dolichol-phosphate mannosyltransferase